MKLRWSMIVAVMPLCSLLSSAPSQASSRVPTPAYTVLRDPVVRLSAGFVHSCHVKDDGTVRCWGDNASGALGDGTTIDQRTPVLVSGLTNAVALAAGGDLIDRISIFSPLEYASYTCALLADGTVRCWGDNAAGQLGDGTTIDRLTPVPVSGLGLSARAVAVAAGSRHTCAVLADGTARGWGNSAAGQLGDGTVTDRLVPTAVRILVGGPIFFEVVSLPDIVQLAAGSGHTCAVRASGVVHCWGQNDLGQLGDGSITDRLRHVEVPSFQAPE